MENIINIDPFPTLHWDDGHWSGEADLDVWNGFEVRPRGSNDPYIAIEAARPIWLHIDTPSHNKVVPSAEQALAFEMVVKHQESFQDAILQKIFEGYPEEQKLFAYDDDEAGIFMPDIAEVSELKSLVRLIGVSILEQSKDGIAYVGYYLDCTWDDEHGIGAMTHNGRIVKLGQASDAYDIWIAREDSGMPMSDPIGPIGHNRPAPKEDPNSSQLELW